MLNDKNGQILYFVQDQITIGLVLTGLSMKWSCLVIVNDFVSPCEKVIVAIQHGWHKQVSTAEVLGIFHALIHSYID